MELKCLVKILKPKEVSLKKLKEYLEKTLKVVKPDKKRLKDGYIELFFSSDQIMAKFNKKYRGKNKATDVLSFSFLEQPAFPGNNLVGQVFISPKIAAKQAIENGWSLSHEIDFLFVHAILHIFGHDHETEKDFEKMFALQKKICDWKGVDEMIEKVRADGF